MYDNVMSDNILIGYYENKAIVSNELGDLFYFECPEKVIPIGSICDSELEDLGNLTEEEQCEIKRRFIEA